MSARQSTNKHWPTQIKYSTIFLQFLAFSAEICHYVSITASDLCTVRTNTDTDYRVQNCVK